MIKVAVSVLACIVLTSIGLGCGSDQAEVASTPPPPKAKFVDNVNEMCRKVEDEKYDLIGVAVRAKAAAGSKPKDEDALLEELTQRVILPVLKKVPENIADMTPPAGDREEVEKVVAAFESDIEKAEEDPQRYIDGVAFRNGNEVAEDYGLNICNF